MIAGIFFEGSGLGDQLFRYITVRTLAEEKGYEWSMINQRPDAMWGGLKGDSFFKGESFMNIDWGKKEMLVGVKKWNEKDVRDAQGNDIRSYDPEINFVEDHTIIDGSFEDSKYWGHNLEHINKWLAVEPLDINDTQVIIGFRGGEYATQPDLFLPVSYWREAMDKIISIKKERHPLKISISHYQVHTDDPTTARAVLEEAQKNSLAGMAVFDFIDNQPISHSKHSNMGFNWRSARYAKYAIIPNSAFFIIPRLLKHLEDPTAITIAPRYWARRNIKTWARPACYYKQFTYI